MTAENSAEHRATMPAGTERFLDARSLAGDHRRLAQLLKEGMSVLDVGCGSGAITRGIARAVGPGGRVVGIDVSEELLALALRTHGGPSNLEFVVADVRRHGYREEFDVVTAARVLQWLADPQAALAAMAAAAKPGGQIIVLDYNHTLAHWEPEPPEPFTRFYAAFLAWRAQAGMDNEIADHLAAMMAQLGLLDVRQERQIELAVRGDGDFAGRMALWPGVIATRGHQLVADAMISESERGEAGEAFERWTRTSAQSQSLHLVAVSARRPPRPD
jgi:ubiquinone/menaquinone biosynthesis C-methylase UbiE